METDLMPFEQHIYQLFLDNPDKKYSCRSTELLERFNERSEGLTNPTAVLSNMLSKLESKGLLTRKLSRVNQRTYYGNRRVKIYFYKLKPITK